ncbi:hypothetical protein ACA910_019213 [Epithemia clementina (nom. ined.)]
MPPSFSSSSVSNVSSDAPGPEASSPSSSFFLWRILLLPTRCCCWPVTSADWHGTFVTLEVVGTAVLCVLYGLHDEATYRWGAILATVLNTHVAYLLTQALFRQAATQQDDEAKDGTAATNNHHNNNNNNNSPSLEQQQNQHEQQQQQQEHQRNQQQPNNRQRVYQYNEIQAKKWSNVFVRMTDAPDDDDKDDDDGSSHRGNSRAERRHAPRASPPPVEGYRHIQVGPCPVSYWLLGVGTTVLATLVVLESWKESPYFTQWTSLTKWTSTMDWFRTSLLLSYGVLCTMLILYTLPDLQLFVQQIYYQCWKLKQQMSSKTTTSQHSDGSAIELQEQGKSSASSRHLLEDQEDGAEQQLQQQQQQQQQEKMDIQPKDHEQGENDPARVSDASAATTSTTKRTAAALPPAPPTRTARQATVSTRIVALILAVVSLIGLVYFARQWSKTVEEISPAMTWRNAAGKNTASLSSFQGDAWVTGYQLVQNNNNNNNQVWCPSSTANEDNNNGEQQQQQQETVVVMDDDADGTGEYIDVLVTVAWGGEWACPNQPETYCQATIETRVSCQVVTHPLTVEAAAAADNNGNDDANNNNDNAQEDAFATVYDYLNYRYQDENNNNNDENAVDWSYDPDQAPNSQAEQQDNNDGSSTTMVVSWNRQAEFVLANCQNCQARSVHDIQSHFPAVAQSLHGLFPCLGALLASLLWALLLLPMAQQMQSQRTKQPALAWQTLM